MSTIGKSRRPMSPKPMAWDNTNGRPSWSPDGKRVAAEVGRDVVVMNREGGAVLNNIGPQGKWVECPSWSPDGERIAYATFAKHPGSETSGWGIYTCAPDGSDTKFLTADGMKPEYSPEGKRIAFQLNKSSDEWIGVMHSDGTDVKIVSGGGFIQKDLSWSPGGHQIAYDSMDSQGVRVTDITGKKDRALTDGAGGYYQDKNPEWSPDGNSVLFERNSTAVVANGLFTKNLKTGRESEILAVNKRNLDAVWSPDGSKIAFVSDRDGGDDLDLYVMNADGTDMKQVTDLPGNEHAPSWSPDGGAIAYNRLIFGAPPEDKNHLEIIELKD